MRVGHIRKNRVVSDCFPFVTHRPHKMIEGTILFRIAMETCLRMLYETLGMKSSFFVGFPMPWT
jgi:hypothetical protein